MGNEPPINVIQEGQSSGHIPDWVGRERPPTGSRERMREVFQDTQNIGGAADALCVEGAIVYDQSIPAKIGNAIDDAAEAAGHDPEDQAVNRAKRDARREWGSSYIGQARPGDLLHPTRGNCYEFVHLAAWLAADQDGLLHNGNTLRTIIEPETMEEWDGSSDIPRGKVIVSCSWFGGQTSDNTYHAAVSLGDGDVANNRGDGVQRERMYDVFGGFSLYSLPGGRIYFGDYACYAEKESFYDDEAAVVEPEEGPATPPPPHKAPSSAKEQRRRGAVGGGVAAGVASFAVFFTFVFGFGDDVAPDCEGVTPLPPQCEAPASDCEGVTPLPPECEAPAVAAPTGPTATAATGATAPAPTETLRAAPLARQFIIKCDPDPLKIAHGETGVITLTGPFDNPLLIESLRFEWDVSDIGVVTESGGIILDVGDEFTSGRTEPGVGVRQRFRSESHTITVSTVRDGTSRTEFVNLTIRLRTPSEVDSFQCQVVVDHEDVGAPVTALTPTPTPEPVTPASTATPEPVTPASTATPAPVTPASTPTPAPVTPASTPTPAPVTPATTPTPAPVTPATTPTPAPVTPASTPTPATVEVDGVTVTYTGPTETDAGGTLPTTFRVEGPSVVGSTLFATLGDPPSDALATHGSSEIGADGTVTITLDVLFPSGPTLLYISFAGVVLPIAEIQIR